MCPSLSRQYIFYDDISLTYSGERLLRADDSAPECGFSGATDFLDGASAAVQRTENHQKISSVTPYSIHGADAPNSTILPNPWITDTVSNSLPFEYGNGKLLRVNYQGGMRLAPHVGIASGVGDGVGTDHGAGDMGADVLRADELVDAGVLQRLAYIVAHA